MYIQYLNEKDFFEKEDLVAEMEKYPKVSPLIIACKKKLWNIIPDLLGIFEIKETINHFKGKLNALCLAACNGRADIVQLLRMNGALTTDEELLNWAGKDGETLLMYAVNNGTIEGVRYLLDTIPQFKDNIDFYDFDYKTALYDAILRGREDIVKLLRENGAEATDKELVDWVNIDFESLLMVAAFNGWIEGVRYLLEKVPNFKSKINLISCNNTNALHLAALKGRGDIVALLRENGATTSDKELADWRNENGETLLMVAVENGWIKTVRYLLENISDFKKNIDCKCFNEKTALHFAVLNGRADIVELLRENGAETTDENLAKWRSKYGASLLMLAMAFCGKNWVKGVRYLLENTYKNNMEEIYAKNKSGETVLHFLSFNRQESGMDFICYLIETIPQFKNILNAVDNQKKTAFHYAIYNKDLRMAKLILKIASDEQKEDMYEKLANWRDSDGNSCLMKSADRFTDNVQFLLNISAVKNTINEKNALGLTALHIAIANGKMEIFNLLRDNGAATTDRELASWRGSVDHVSFRSLLMYTIVRYTISEHMLDGIRYLLDIPEIKNTINCEVFVDSENRYYYPLTFCVGSWFWPKYDKAQEELVKLLLAAGASVDNLIFGVTGTLRVSDTEIYPQEISLTITPIITAAKNLVKLAQSHRCDPLQFNLLLETGASYNQKTQDPNTHQYVSIFEIALISGNTEMIFMHFLNPIRALLNEIDNLRNMKKIKKNEVVIAEDKKIIVFLDKSLKTKRTHLIQKTKTFLTWFNERDLHRVDSLTKSEIYFKIADLIVNNIELLSYENFGYEFTVAYLKSVERGTPFYENAQLKLAEIYLVQEPDSKEEREIFLEEAFVHAFEAGDSPEAANLRKMLMQIAIKARLEIIGDPKNSAVLFRTFLMLGKMLTKISEDKVETDTKKQKNVLDEKTKDKNVSLNNNLFLAYKNVPILDDKKHMLDPTEKSDSESKKRRNE